MKDELVIGGMMLLITHVCLATFSVVVLHSPFSSGEFGTGAAAILGAMGGGMGVRNWLVGKGEAVKTAAAGWGGMKPVLEEDGDAKP